MLETDAVSAAAITRYAVAVELARRYHAANALVLRTLRRLDELDVVVGPAGMQAAMETVPGLEYAPGMFSAK